MAKRKSELFDSFVHGSEAASTISYWIRAMSTQIHPKLSEPYKDRRWKPNADPSVEVRSLHELVKSVVNHGAVSQRPRGDLDSMLLVLTVMELGDSKIAVVGLLGGLSSDGFDLDTGSQMTIMRIDDSFKEGSYLSRLPFRSDLGRSSTVNIEEAKLDISVLERIDIHSNDTASDVLFSAQRSAESMEIVARGMYKVIQRAKNQPTFILDGRALEAYKNDCAKAMSRRKNKLPERVSFVLGEGRSVDGYIGVSPAGDLLTPVLPPRPVGYLAPGSNSDDASTLIDGIRGMFPCYDLAYLDRLTDLALAGHHKIAISFSESGPGNNGAIMLASPVGYPGGIADAIVVIAPMRSVLDLSRSAPAYADPSAPAQEQDVART